VKPHTKRTALVEKTGEEEKHAIKKKKRSTGGKRGAEGESGKYQGEKDKSGKIRPRGKNKNAFGDLKKERVAGRGFAKEKR